MVEIIILLFLIYLIVHDFLSIDNIDESFTMSLIKNSYINIIKIDSLDVHPPLYYLVLKTFIIITTFWTNNINIKIIFARIFSLLCLFLIYIISVKTLNKMHLKYYKNFLFILIVMISFMFSLTFNIRMYSFAALFISLEVYEIVEYIHFQKKVNVVLMIIFAICATYTHDFAALISGILFISLFSFSIYYRKYKESLKWIYSGMFLIISYLPWMYISFLQIYNIPSSNWITINSDVKSTFEFGIFTIILGLPIICLHNYVNYKDLMVFKLLFMSCIVMLFIEILVSLILRRPIFELRYIYPLLIVYMYISIIIDFNVLNIMNNMNIRRIKFYCLKIPLILIILLLCVDTCRNIHQTLQLHYSAVKFLGKYINSNRDKYKLNYINIRKITNNYNNPNRLYLFNTYSQYDHKILSKKENKLITNSKLADKANQGNRPHLRYLVWHTKV